MKNSIQHFINDKRELVTSDMIGQWICRVEGGCFSETNRLGQIKYVDDKSIYIDFFDGKGSRAYAPSGGNIPEDAQYSTAHWHLALYK